MRIMRRFKHLKRGTTYVLISDNAKLQANWSEDGWAMVIYQSEHDGSVWCRPKEEFYDGRFVEIDLNGGIIS